jgi:transposase, IS30 family
MSYGHLSRSEQFELYQYRIQENLTLDAIVSKMKRAKSTISRELKRNSLDGTLYLPDSAHIHMQTRRQQAKQRFMSMSQSTIVQVKQRLVQYHSPEQLAGRMQREGLESVSHETIYQMIYANHQGLGAYQPYLRQGCPKRRRRQGVNQKRGVSQNEWELSIVLPLPR